MGQTASRDADFAQSLERSKKLEQINKQAHRVEQQRVKLLLLGAGESGKSTIFKQMEILYGTNFPESERATMVSVVHSNVLGNIRALAQACTRFTPLSDASLASELAAVPDAEDTVIDARVADLCKRIWADAGAKATWAVKSQFQIQDSLAWYMESIDRIGSSNYIPSIDDILRARVRTSGIVEKTYRIDKVEFAMYDVGGQRNERKKWIHLFDNVTAVIFVAAVNEYDQMLYEDEQMYRMDEALLLFDEVCNMKHFRNTAMILFLNKTDLFREKLRTTPVRIDGGDRERYTDFEGPFVKIGTPEAEFGNPAFEAACGAAQEYFLQLFLRRKGSSPQEIYVHWTSATDTQNVRIVFGVCKDHLLKIHLRSSGFLE